MKKNKFIIWSQEFPEELMAPDVTEYLSKYINEPPSVESLWQEMDRIWDEMGLSNTSPLRGQPVGDYYSHPVWVLNGLFSASDSDSSAHRDAIVDYVLSLKGREVADYGGGFGELAIRLASKLPSNFVNIIEPFPSAIGRYRISKFSNIFISSELGQDYDVVTVQDVLEHIEDPVGLVIRLADAVKPNGHIVFANCFYPVIKCHLPSTFHLRYTFPWVVRAAGLHLIGTVPGAPHAQVFKKINIVDRRGIRIRERYSKIFGGPINLCMRTIKNTFRELKSFGNK